MCSRVYLAVWFLCVYALFITSSLDSVAHGGEYTGNILLRTGKHHLWKSETGSGQNQQEIPGGLGTNGLSFTTKILLPETNVVDSLKHMSLTLILSLSKRQTHTSYYLSATTTHFRSPQAQS